MEIKRAGVIGAGVMGGGIAAHLANAGISTVLLDLVPGAAGAALERLRKADPAAFMHPRFAARVRPGDLGADLNQLADVDWIIEAITEDPQAKKALYQTIETIRRPGSIVSSNTSTIPLRILLAGSPPRLAQDFMITHFFNPPRYMRLLELVVGPQTRPEAVATIAAFADGRLGKGVVFAKDTPGFIANRIGGFWLQTALTVALAQDVRIEDADAVLGRPFGIPKTGVFGLLDLVGIDLIPHVARSLSAALPSDDRFCAVSAVPELIRTMIAEGRSGRKSRSGGFYRMVSASGGGKTKEALDLRTGAYRPAVKSRLESVEIGRRNLAAMMAREDAGGRYARAVMGPTLAYAARLAPEIADSVEAVDRAMRLGYNWTHGPFALLDRLRAEAGDCFDFTPAGDRFDFTSWFAAAAGESPPVLLTKAAGRSFYRTGEKGAAEALDFEGVYRPLPQPEGVLRLADVKRGAKPELRNGSASVWDLGDGVLCFEITTHMNVLDADVMALIRKTLALIGDGCGRWRALVFYSDAENFSVGVNLGLAMFGVNLAAWEEIEALVRDGQETYRALQRAPFPVVAAPAGMALGGGCELLLHCHAVQACAESYIGLVEAGVGLLPAWGGSTALLARHFAETHQLVETSRPQGPIPAIAAAFESIGMAKVSKSADEARDLKFLRPSDGVTMNRDRLLADAKARALAMTASFRPYAETPLPLPGATAGAALELMVNALRLSGKISEYDAVVAGRIATVLSGGERADITRPISEDDVRALERREFMALIRQPKTLARIEHTLATGKPLRN